MSARPTAMKPDQTLALLREYAAARTAHGAQSADALAIRNAIVAGNVGLVFTVWKMHGRRQVAHEDVMGIGALGLIKAVERFDLTHGVRFSTYATWWIRHALSRTAANEATTIRIPVYAQSRKGPVGAAYRESVQAARAGTVSLDARLTADARDTFADHTADADALAAFHELEADDEQTALHAALAQLPELEREVVQARAAGEPLRDAAARLKVSPDRARQLETRGLARLRRALAA